MTQWHRELNKPFDRICQTLVEKTEEAQVELEVATESTKDWLELEASVDEVVIPVFDRWLTELRQTQTMLTLTPFFTELTAARTTLCLFGQRLGRHPWILVARLRNFALWLWVVRYQLLFGLFLLALLWGFGWILANWDWIASIIAEVMLVLEEQLLLSPP